MRKASTPEMSYSGSTRRRRLPGWLIAMISVLILLAVGSGIFAALRYSVLGQSAVKTPVLRMPDTPTGIPLENLSTAQLYQSIINQKRPFLVDPLDGSNPPGNWDDGPGCQFQQKAFYLAVSPSLPVIICFLRNEFVQDFAFQIQVTFGPTTNLGEQQGCALLFRTHLVQQEGYEFNLNTYSKIDPLTLSVVTENNASLNIIRSGGDSELKSWNQGLPSHMNALNVLTVIAVGSRIDLYINGQSQLTMTNSAFRAGQIGLVSSSSFNIFQGTFEVAFRNMKLWIL